MFDSLYKIAPNYVHDTMHYCIYNLINSSPTWNQHHPSQHQLGAIYAFLPAITHLWLRNQVQPCSSDLKCLMWTMKWSMNCTELLCWASYKIVHKSTIYILAEGSITSTQIYKSQSISKVPLLQPNFVRAIMLRNHSIVSLIRVPSMYKTYVKTLIHRYKIR